MRVPDIPIWVLGVGMCVGISIYLWSLLSLSAEMGPALERYRERERSQTERIERLEERIEECGVKHGH